MWRAPRRANHAQPQEKAMRGCKSPKAVKGRTSIFEPNRVNREFTVDAPDHVWVTKYFNMTGWQYLDAVLDLHTSAVVGWSMKHTIAKEVVLDALMMAVWRRKPTKEVIVHSDQGSQYGSDDWKQFCEANKLLPSISRRDKC